MNFGKIYCRLASDSTHIKLTLLPCSSWEHGAYSYGTYGTYPYSYGTSWTSWTSHHIHSEMPIYDKDKQSEVNLGNPYYVEYI